MKKPASKQAAGAILNVVILIILRGHVNGLSRNAQQGDQAPSATPLCRQFLPIFRFGRIAFPR